MAVDLKVGQVASTAPELCAESSREAASGGQSVGHR